MSGFSLSRILGSFEESKTLALGAKAKKMAAEGRSIISFASGEPDFGTPRAGIEAAYRSALGGNTKYTPVAGTSSLRRAIAARLSEDYGVSFSEEEVAVSNGGKQSIYHLLQALLNPGDEVLIPSPYWTSFPEMVKLVGGTPVIVPTEDGQLKPEALQRAITPKTKLFIFNSPSNPSGRVYSEEELGAFLKVIEPHPIWLLSDDTYYPLVFEPAKWVSALRLRPDFRDRTCIVGSASKAYAMTGWRLGWAVTRPDLVKAVVKLQGQVTSGASSLSQAAAEELLKNAAADVEAFRKLFEARRNLVLEKLSKFSGLTWMAPEGAFYVFFELQTLLKGESVTAFCERLLEQKGVCLVPGEAFGEPDYARLSYALSEEEISEGIRRLEEALRS